MMTQKKHSKLVLPNNRRQLLLTEVEAPKIQKNQKKKKSVPPIHICKGENGSTKEVDIDIGQEGIHFPEEIVMDILSRLPVRSLQRFKCVSPSWNALIADRNFILKHLDHAKNDHDSQKLLSIRQLTIKNHMLEFYQYSFSSSSIQVFEDEQRLDWPPNCKPAWITRCCYDGLVLLSTVDTSDQHTNVPHLLLWNPSTRESTLLPSREHALSSLVFGLGYDATSDDYKILAADVNGEESSEEVSVEIFPIKAGSWRKIGKYPTGIRRVSGHLNYGMYSLTFIHGAFHWVGRSAYYTIISFNISNEVYGEIPLLEQIHNMHKYALDHGVYTHNHGVSVLRGMLCYYSMPKYGWPSTFTLWAMKDYGIKESWIQLHEIRDTNGLASVATQYMFADDDVLLRFRQLGSSTSLYWTSKRGMFELWPEIHKTIVYTESLISPKLLSI